MQIKKNTKFYLSLLLLMVGFQGVKAQNTDALGTFTPYSLFGIGEIERQGTAFNRGMGGIGVGIRDNRFINYLNPASITARDTLSFLLDFGVDQKNFVNKDKNVRSAYNTFNMHNLVFTAPIYKKSAFMVGICPVSDIGYKFEAMETDSKIVEQYGDIKYQKYGTGSVNKLFLAGAMNINKNLSVGAELIYYFGSLNRHSNVVFSTDVAAKSLLTGWDYSVNAFSTRLGLQYFKPFADNKYQFTAGATYSLKTRLHGDYTRYAFANDASIGNDTISFNTSNHKIVIPGEFAIGFSFKKPYKWTVGFDYQRQGWNNSDFGLTPGVSFKPVASSSYKLGFEYIPNIYDVRYYYKRITYRAGVYYERSYIKIGDKRINAAGITLGCSLPIFRLYNAVNIAVDMGQRGSLRNNLVRERYVQFIVNISLHDIWFIKQRYE